MLFVLSLVEGISIHAILFRELFDFAMLTTLMIGALLLPARAIYDQVLRGRRRIRRLLILGPTPLAWKLLKEIESHPDFAGTIVGLVHDTPAMFVLGVHHPWLGPVDQLGQILDQTRPDRIIVAVPPDSRLPITDLLEARLRGVLIEDGVRVYETLTRKLAIESLTPNHLIFLRNFRISRFQMILRRALSLSAAAIGLLLSAPLMGAIALWIKLDSEGPVLFIQERVGLMGRTFRLLKFRTMLTANGTTSEWVQDNGDRITRVGKWLRKFRLDELPQFVNVLLGDMDFIGPRPHPVSNYRLFVVVFRNTPDCGESIPYYALRSVIRPGITGWAQIRYGYANSIEEEIEKMRYDLYYIKHLSFWFDLWILLNTVKITLLGRGSEAQDVRRAASPVRSRA